MLFTTINVIDYNYRSYKCYK